MPNIRIGVTMYIPLINDNTVSITITYDKIAVPSNQFVM